MKKKYRNIYMIWICLLMLLSGCAKKEEKEEPTEEPLNDVEQYIIREEDPFPYEELNKLFDTYHYSYGDYIGELWFASGLINESVVQGQSNDTYLRTYWKTMEYDSAGSIFMDFRNSLQDQNIVIYGHYVYLSKDPSGTKMFTPLRFLSEEENYEENKTFYLLLNGEIREYEICVVYYCPLYNDNTETGEDMQYYTTNFTEEYFNTYKAAILKEAFYDTGVDFDYSDRFVTLQTCVENRDDLREIVLAKEVKRYDTKK